VAAPGTALALSEHNRERLGRFLAEVLDSLEAEHNPLTERIERLWDVYEGKPRTERRSTPWPGASNVVVPVARTWGGTIIARHFARLTSLKDFWIASTENEEWKDPIAEWMRYLNWGARGNIFDMFLPLWDWLSELVPLGSSHLALSWVNRPQYRYTPHSAKAGRPHEFEAYRGPLLEQVSRQDMLVVPGRSPLDSETVCRRRWMTRHELLAFGRQAGLDEDTLEDVLAAPDGDSQSSRKRADARAGYAGSPNNVPLWDIRDVWIDYPTLRGGRGEEDVIAFDEVDGARPLVPIVVHMHRGTSRVLRVATHPYYFPHKPFYDAHFDKRPGRQDSNGVAAAADHLQRAVTTMLNQSIDAVTLANSMKVATTDKRLVNMRFSPGVPLLVDDINAIKELTGAKHVTPDLALMNFVIATGERLFSTGDPALGRETRMGGHPAPATSTLALLEQLSINVSVSLRFLRHRLSKIGEDISTLFQQFETLDEGEGKMGRVEAALGARDAGVVRNLVLPLDEPISGNVHFDVHALSEVSSPEAERQKIVLESQMVTNYFSKMLGAAQILKTPMGQDPIIQEIVKRAMHAETLTVKRFLDTTGFDVPEEVLLDIGNSRSGGNDAALQQLIAQSVAALGQLGGSPGAVPIPGLEAGAGGLPPQSANGGGAADLQ
jgi:hypothetical protein